MLIPRHLALLSLVAALLTPVAVFADDDNAPYSRVPTLLPLCGPTDSVPIKDDLCKRGGYDGLAAQLDKAIQAAAAKAPANVRPLLKRDQAFFYEMIAMAAEEMPQSDKAEIRKQFDDMLRNRIAMLAQIGEGFGRSSVFGKWVDAFGSVVVTPADNGAYGVALNTSSIYASVFHGAAVSGKTFARY